MQKKRLSEEDFVAHKTAEHPCFNCTAGKQNARIHLPIAPQCNIQCNYCVRKYDCVNESRPGVTSTILSPAEAVDRFKKAKKSVPNLAVVGIAGSGDALANFDEVKETLSRIHSIDPDITFCLSTNGLMLPFYVNHIISLGVTHVTVTVNSVDPAVGAKIYHHVTYLGKEHKGEEGASLLLQNQLSGIRYLSSMGVVVKVNIVVIKGINDHEIAEIVYMVKDCGCKLTNIMPLIPVEGSAFEFMKTMSQNELSQIRVKCETMLPQMYHCRQCRADAVGILGHDLRHEFV
jgi:nitrogen fixation protein NifB